jgi:hypothetical protein
LCGGIGGREKGGGGGDGGCRGFLVRWSGVMETKHHNQPLCVLFPHITFSTIFSSSFTSRSHLKLYLISYNTIRYPYQVTTSFNLK